MFKKRKSVERIVFDREKQRPVLRCSICNGEQVAGLKDISNGKFQEVMVIRSSKDLDMFCQMCGVEDVPKEY